MSASDRDLEKLDLGENGRGENRRDDDDGEPRDGVTIRVRAGVRPVQLETGVRCGCSEPAIHLHRSEPTLFLIPYPVFLKFQHAAHIQESAAADLQIGGRG